MALATKHDRRIHPGSGRRRGPDHPKGRQVDPAALGEIQALLDTRERRRDLLIEHLHLLQDHFGCLYARHLAALAEEMRLALVEVYEVASFYAHFDIVMDDEKMTFVYTGDDRLKMTPRLETFTPEEQEALLALLPHVRR